MGCVFCEIVERRAPAEILAESAEAVAFLDINPWSEGHCLVVPKRHASGILDVSPADAAAVARMVTEVARLLDRALRPDGINVLQNNGRAAGQIVFHYHVHLIPRREGDGLFKGKRPGPIGRDALSELGTRLRPPERGEP